LGVVFLYRKEVGSAWGTNTPTDVGSPMLVVGFPNSPKKNCPSGGPEKNGMFARE